MGKYNIMSNKEKKIQLIKLIQHAKDNSFHIDLIKSYELQLLEVDKVIKEDRAKTLGRKARMEEQEGLNSNLECN